MRSPADGNLLTIIPTMIVMHTIRASVVMVTFLIEYVAHEAQHDKGDDKQTDIPEDIGGKAEQNGQTQSIQFLSRAYLARAASWSR